MITAHLQGLTSISSSDGAFSLYEKKRFGEKQGSKIIFSLYETLFLLDQKKLELHDKSKKIDFHTFLRKAKQKNKNVYTSYLTFSDLTEKGYTVKAGLKFGVEFRAYAPGSKPGTQHAPWLVYPVEEHEKQSWHTFAAKNRIAVTTNKKILLAIVDTEGKIIYYEVAWFKP